MTELSEVRAEALERERIQDQDPEVEEEPVKKTKQKQIHTLSQEDIDEIASYDQNEAQYLEALNIDLEEESRQKKEGVIDVNATTGAIDLTVTTTVDDSNKNLLITESEPASEIDLDQTKAYVMKYIARQDIAQGLAAMEANFYDRVQSVTGIMTESALFNLEKFITERLDFIIHYSKEFSENINIKLTKEESQLYTAISELVSNYRKNMCKKLKITE